MIKVKERVECVDEKSSHFGEKGTFIGYIANGLKIKFDDGKEDLFLPSSLRKI